MEVPASTNSIIAFSAGAPRRAGIRADTPALGNRNAVPFDQCNRWLRHAAQSLLPDPGSRTGRYKNTRQLGLLLLSERDRRVRQHRPPVLGQPGQTRRFYSFDFPTRFPTELLTTGWEMAGLDGRRLVKNA